MDTKETLARWNAHMAMCKDKLAKGEKLTEDEAVEWDFIEQKLDDYRSDYYGQAGL